MFTTKQDVNKRKNGHAELNTMNRIKGVRSSKSNSPFRYAGGKFYARKIILHHIPKTPVYCEPFAGGASIFFAKEPSKVSILNDIDSDVINTLIHIRDHSDALINMLKGITVTKTLHDYYKNKYRPKNDLERAFRWFYLNRTSYSGIMKLENCYFGYHEKYSMRPENWLPHLRTVSDRLQGVRLTCNDFEAVIDNAPDNSFLFVDPPYYKADQKKFYTHNFDLQDHIRLRNCLFRNNKRLRFLVTYDNTAEILGMYTWCPSVEQQEWQYTINRTDDQKNGRKLVHGHSGARSNGREIFIKNYDMKQLQACQQIRLPIEQGDLSSI